MTEVNVMLSVERKLEAAVASSDFKEFHNSTMAQTAYKLGYCESMLTNVLHQICGRFGEEAMLRVMEGLDMNPVYRG